MIEDYDCLEHSIYGEETRECAYTEGWATFFALTAHPFQDQYVAFPGGFYDMENHNHPNAPTGDTVEGWVAGALYDMWDDNSDGYDQAEFSFDDIWDMMKTTDPNATDGFFSYWNEWKMYYAAYDATGDHNHYGVQAIYQNTIDYNTAPTISLPPLLMNTPENFPLDNVIDLHARSSDPESVDSRLEWQITFLDSFCSPTNINGQYVDVEILYLPTETRFCHVEIDVNDGIETMTGAFDVVIFVPTSWIYIPLVQRPEGYEIPSSNPPGSNPYPPPLSPTQSAPTPPPPPYP